jgi:hypothetical protein
MKASSYSNLIGVYSSSINAYCTSISINSGLMNADNNSINTYSSLYEYSYNGIISIHCNVYPHICTHYAPISTSKNFLRKMARGVFVATL